MSTTYPVRVDGELDGRLNRWLWLVKWVLVIPHLFVLAALWIAFAVLSFVVFFAILFTGRYPRGIFDFNVGVLRWTWRVQFYAYGALGTDKYPPFTLADVPDYPAHLDVAYPEHLSRGLVLVKWWLLAIPHYIVVGLFIGGGNWAAGRAENGAWGWGSGLVGLLVLVAAVVLLFTGRYPRPVFDFVLGMDRWALRVAAYAGLMVDQYPPFRLDMGGPDPATTRLHEPPPEPPHRPSTSAGRIVALVVSLAVALLSVVGLVTGSALAWLDQGRRDTAGFVTSGTVALSTGGYALSSEALTIRSDVSSLPHRWLGDARIRVTATNGEPVFVGLATTADAERYLAGVEYATVKSAAPTYAQHDGSAPAVPPTREKIWRVEAFGGGTQTITFPVQTGDWTMIVMSADAGRGVSVQADAGLTAPALQPLWIGIVVSSVLFLLLGTAGVVIAVSARPRSDTARGAEDAG